MKHTTRTLIASALAAASATVAADDGISANVALATDYMFRGVSQTDNQMALQGGFDWSHESGFYAGTWASNVAPSFFQGPTDPQLEWDLYLGFSGEMDAFGYDVGVIRYIYPGADASNTTEIYFGGSYSISDDVSVGATFYYSPELDFVASTDSAWYLSLSGEMGVAEGVSVHAGLGYSFGDTFDDTPYKSYWDYSLGVSGSLAGVDLDLSWIGTDGDGEDNFGGVTDDRVVLTVSKSF